MVMVKPPIALLDLRSAAAQRPHGDTTAQRGHHSVSCALTGPHLAAEMEDEGRSIPGARRPAATRSRGDRKAGAGGTALRQSFMGMMDYHRSDGYNYSILQTNFGSLGAPREKANDYDR